MVAARVLVHDGVLLMGGGLAVVAAPQPAQQVPVGVAVQDLTLVGVGSGGEDVAEKPFQAGHLLVTFRQCPGGDEHAAQVREDRAGVQFIQFGMGEFAAAGGDVGQDRSDGLFGKPPQCGAGRIGCRQRLLQRMQGGVGGAVGAGE
jgi:hypothetical protein